MTPSAFISAIGPGAKQSNIDTGIPASITIAQAALESGWGKSGLTMQAKNLFGIKALGNWSGPTVTMPTQEYENGQWVTVNSAFRAYPSWQASLDDHAKFFFVNSRYVPALAIRADSNEWAKEIQACGYATDPTYADTLIEIASQFGLYSWDVPETEWKLLPWAEGAGLSFNSPS